MRGTEHSIAGRRDPIDLGHLTRQTQGDRGLEIEVLRLFDAQLPVYFARIRETRDHAALAMGLHTLRSASLGVGATVLARMAGAAEEELARTGAVDAETLDDLEMAVAETSAYIGRLLGA